MATGEPQPATEAAYYWQRHKDLVDQAVKAPFVRALGAGKLSSQIFDIYIEEDIFFLDVFALALVVAMNKARSLAPAVTGMLSELHSGIAEELKLHKGYQDKLCQKAAEHPAEHKATTNYTDFLTQTAEKEDVAGIVASMTPCFRLYSYIGCKLAAEHEGHDHAFSAWIRTYSGTDFLQQADKIEELFNVLAKEEDRERLSRLYKRALELEIGFFDAYKPVIES